MRLLCLVDEELLLSGQIELNVVVEDRSEEQLESEGEIPIVPSEWKDVLTTSLLYMHFTNISSSRISSVSTVAH